jgi:hypothetical protein
MAIFPIPILLRPFIVKLGTLSLENGKRGIPDLSRIWKWWFLEL